MFRRYVLFSLVLLLVVGSSGTSVASPRTFAEEELRFRPAEGVPVPEPERTDRPSVLSNLTTSELQEVLVSQFGGEMHGDAVVLGDGAVVYDPSATANPCVAPYVCIYDAVNFSGTVWKFRDVGYWQYLSAYGAANRMESVINSRSGLTNFWDQSTGAYYCVSANSSRSFLPNYANNTMDQIYLATAPACT